VIHHAGAFRPGAADLRTYLRRQGAKWIAAALNAEACTGNRSQRGEAVRKGADSVSARKLCIVAQLLCIIASCVCIDPHQEW
jgi:hypothetical protein